MANARDTCGPASANGNNAPDCGNDQNGEASIDDGLDVAEPQCTKYKKNTDPSQDRNDQHAVLAIGDEMAKPGDDQEDLCRGGKPTLERSERAKAKRCANKRDLRKAYRAGKSRQECPERAKSVEPGSHAQLP
jgi:hypothetical protein